MAEKLSWHHGYQVDRFEFEGHPARVVIPAEGTAIGRLAFKTEYWNAFPEGIQLPLLKKGFHICHIDKENRWGTDEMTDLLARFAKFVTEKYDLNPKIVPLGMSCGGLQAIQLAARHPELVEVAYLDNPVLNYMSCPCGFGKAQVLDDGDAIPEILKALGLNSMSQLICYRQMPMDRLPLLVQHRIPVVMVGGLMDDIAPYEENGLLLQHAYEKAGIPLGLFLKPEDGHHPHGLADPTPAVEFILQYCK